MHVRYVALILSAGATPCSALALSGTSHAAQGCRGGLGLNSKGGVL